MKIINRKTKKIEDLVYDKSLIFLYHNFLGRIILKIITLPFISKIIGKYMNSSLSKKRIEKTIKQYNIKMSEFEEKEFTCFNDFFLRRKKQIHFDVNKNHFVSPCDAKLLVIKLNKEASFDVKKSIYNLKNIIDKDLTDVYENGYALIFRLAVNDYHHYHFIDDGSRDEYTHIKGILHTVQPIAYEKYPVFHRNTREYTVLHTKNFGDILQIEVGALIVGKITNDHEKKVFKRGEEKGYFEFGGSTIILFVPENVVQFDDDLLFNSLKGYETIVSCGEKIGEKTK